MLARPKAWLHRTAAYLDQAAFSPASLPNDLTTAIALAPTVAAGLIIYKLPAGEMLAVALACGIAGQLIARFAWRHEVPPRRDLATRLQRPWQPAPPSLRRRRTAAGAPEETAV